MTATAPRKSAPHSPKSPTQARKAEAEGFAIVEQCGVKFRIGLGENMPFEVIEEMSSRPEPQSEAERREYDLAVTKALLGPDQWGAFRAAQPTVRDYNELCDKINGLTGN